MQVGENQPEEGTIGAHSRYVSTRLLAVSFRRLGNGKWEIDPSCGAGVPTKTPGARFVGGGAAPFNYTRFVSGHGFTGY
jgi:hypothetical protein